MTVERLAADLEAHIAWLNLLIPERDCREAPAQPTAASSYAIPVCPASETETDCDDCSSAAEIRGQAIPEWARAQHLPALLRAQRSIDPDAIFPDFGRTCDLSAIFETQNRRFGVRGDSARWDDDGDSAPQRFS
jgi:hypothetical protein